MWSHSSPGAPAAGLGAGDASQVGKGAEVERGAQLGGDVAPEVGNGVQRHPVVQDGFDERVAAEVPDDPQRQGPATEQVAGLTGVGVAWPPCPQVDHEDQVGPVGPSLPPALDQPDEGVGGVRLPRLTAAGSSLLSADAVGVGVEAVHDREPHLRRERSLEWTIPCSSTQWRTERAA